MQKEIYGLRPGINTSQEITYALACSDISTGDIAPHCGLIAAANTAHNWAAYTEAFNALAQYLPYHHTFFALIAAYAHLGIITS